MRLTLQNVVERLRASQSGKRLLVTKQLRELVTRYRWHADRDEKMKIYVYTIPKAGTYFIAGFLSRIGFVNTGYHVMANYFLDTHAVDLGTNIATPSEVMKEASFVKTLRSVPQRGVAFGHFPAPFLPDLIPRYFFICAYRHPRKTLVSEFIDFRFRRSDIEWLSREAVESDCEAFCVYLDRHGPVHMRIFGEMIGVASLVQEELCLHMDPVRFFFLNFDEVLQGGAVVTRLAKRLGVPSSEAGRALTDTLAAETKTKATGVDVDRDALWSPRAEQLYRALRAEEYVKRGRQLGWSI